MHPRAISALIALLIQISAFGQVSDTFFRGREHPGYSFAYNGNCWWDHNPEFRPGTVFYDGREYTGYLLNIDAHMQRLLVKRPGEVLPLMLDPSLLQSASFDGRLFVSAKATGCPDAADGLYEVLCDGADALLRRVDKRVFRDARPANGQLIGYYDHAYRDNLSTYFEYSESFFLLRDGKLYPVHSRSDLFRLYSNEERRGIKAELRRNCRFSPRSEKAQYLCAAVKAAGKGGDSIISELSAFPEPAERDRHSGIYDKAASVQASPRPAALPEGWFDSASGDDSFGAGGTTINAIYRNKVYEIGKSSDAPHEKAIISGYVYDFSDHAPVIGAVIFETAGGNYTTSDELGRWSLEMPCGPNRIEFKETTMEDFSVMVEVFSDASINVMMMPHSEMLRSAMISADSRAAHRRAAMGVESLGTAAVGAMPAAFGEGDVLKAVQSLPGVQSSGEASSGINVRGGSPDQNLILLSGNTIYNPNHLFGIFSSFNPDMVAGAELYKSSVPAEFGGRLSSVLDVHTKDGSFEKLSGSAGIGIFTSHLFLETPLKKGSTSLALGARTTYSDWILSLIPENSGYSGGSAGFSDINARITHKTGKGAIIRADVYWSRDRFAFAADTSFRYSNFNAALSLEKKLGSGTLMRASAGYDRTGSGMSDRRDSYNACDFNTSTAGWFGHLAFDTEFNDAHRFTYGAEAIAYQLNPGRISPIGTESSVLAAKLDEESALQAALWAGDSWTPGEHFSIDAALRLSAFSHLADAKTYVNPEVRLSAKYSPDPNTSFKAGFLTMTQYIHLISNSNCISPVDSWKLSDADIKPQKGWQASLGAYRTVLDGSVDFSAEGYFKHSSGYPDYKSGAQLMMNPNLANDLVPTVGRAYGIELMARKNSGNLTGWVSYCWSRSKLREVSDRGMNAINRGEWYNSPFDKPHNLNISGNYRFTHRYSMSLAADWSTGRPITVPIGHYYYAGAYRLEYSDRNAMRVPDYFRLDAAVVVEQGHNLRKKVHFSGTFGVYNITGRKNAYSIYYTSAGARIEGHLVSIFATPVPYISLNMKF